MVFKSMYEHGLCMFVGVSVTVEAQRGSGVFCLVFVYYAVPKKKMKS